MPHLITGVRGSYRVRVCLRDGLEPHPPAALLEALLQPDIHADACAQQRPCLLEEEHSASRVTTR